MSLTLRSAVHSNLTSSSVEAKDILTITKYGQCKRLKSRKIIRPSSPILKLSVLKGSDPPCPCLGGAPGLKKLLKLDPTFQTNTAHSSSDTVTSLRPSGEKLHAVVLFLWPSKTYRRVAVFRSYMTTAPSLVPTTNLWLPM